MSSGGGLCSGETSGPVLKGYEAFALALYCDQDGKLEGYSDANWAGGVRTRTVTELREYVALDEGCQEAVWLRKQVGRIR